MRVVDEFENGFGWQADTPEYVERTSHAVAIDGGVASTAPGRGLSGGR